MRVKRGGAGCKGGACYPLRVVPTGYGPGKGGDLRTARDRACPTRLLAVSANGEVGSHLIGAHTAHALRVRRGRSRVLRIGERVVEIAHAVGHLDYSAQGIIGGDRVLERGSARGLHVARRVSEEVVGVAGLAVGPAPDVEGVQHDVLAGLALAVSHQLHRVGAVGQVSTRPGIDLILGNCRVEIDGGLERAVQVHIHDAGGGPGHSDPVDAGAGEGH